MNRHLDNLSEPQFIQTEGRQFLLEAVSVLRTILRPEELKKRKCPQCDRHFLLYRYVTNNLWLPFNI